MSARGARTNPAVLSYHTLRRAVGIIALSLPFVLALGAILIPLLGPDHVLPQPLFQRSISDYYYTPMGDYLIGSLGAIAAFLICSRGYDLADEIAGYMAGIFTMGTALFPSVNPRLADHTLLQLRMQSVHTCFAALMFLTLAYFCIFQFRKSSPEKTFTRRKRRRNVLYLICGDIIIGSMIVMLAGQLDPFAQIFDPFRPLLVSETLALAAFGTAWLTKGEVFLKDRHRDQVLAMAGKSR